jgi:hypothetical protein
VYQIRISPVVPVSGYAEAYAFGPLFFILTLVTLFVAFRSANLVARRESGLIPILLNLLIALACVTLFSYNVRNGYRLILYAIVVSIVVLNRRQIISAFMGMRRGARKTARHVT